MIDFIEPSTEKPYQIFFEAYNEALKSNQPAIEAIALSSFDKKLNQVDSRFVNLKYIVKDEWIFFSNYNSNKSKSFEMHPQIGALFYWKATNTQIRIKANISKTSNDFSDKHFNSRSKEKNALAISSDQSKPIESYEQVKAKYYEILNNKDKLQTRPSFWGGYSVRPFSFEFWIGDEFRLNKRTVYEKKDGEWIKNFLQP